jgi:hypothetical protein
LTRDVFAWIFENSERWIRHSKTKTFWKLFQRKRSDLWRKRKRQDELHGLSHTPKNASEDCVGGESIFENWASRYLPIDRRHNGKPLRRKRDETVQKVIGREGLSRVLALLDRQEDSQLRIAVRMIFGCGITPTEVCRKLEQLGMPIHRVTLAKRIAAFLWMAKSELTADGSPLDDLLAAGEKAVTNTSRLPQSCRLDQPSPLTGPKYLPNSPRKRRRALDPSPRYT